VEDKGQQGTTNLYNNDIYNPPFLYSYA